MARNSRSIGKPQLHWLQETPGQRERRFDARSPHRATQLTSRRGLTNGDQVQKGREEVLALLNPPSHKRISTLALIPPLKRLGSPRSEVGGSIPERENWVLEGKRNHRGSQYCIPNRRKSQFEPELEKKTDAWRESHAKMVSVVLLAMGLLHSKLW